MCGTRNDVATKLLQEESRALYTHCYAHAFNLSVADTVKSKLYRDALDTAFEVNRLVKFSQKRNAAFEKIRCSHQEGTPTPVGICTFCQTHWTVRGDSLESIPFNYKALADLWEECLESVVHLDSDSRSHIIGIKAVMNEFKFLIGLKLSENTLKMTDNLSRMLQKTALSTAEAQHLASLTEVCRDCEWLKLG